MCSESKYRETDDMVRHYDALIPFPAETRLFLMLSMANMSRIESVAQTGQATVVVPNEKLEN